MNAEKIGPYNTWVHQNLGDATPPDAYGHGCKCYNCGCQAFFFIRKGTPVNSSGIKCKNCGVSVA